MPDTDNLRTILRDLTPLSNRLDSNALGLFLEELLTWNPQIGLVSKKDTTGVIVRLIKQSVALWDFAVADESSPPDASFRVADVGTGGGFPGVVWKILAPDVDMVLIERRAGKVFFLERVATRWGVKGLQVLGQDVRNVALDPSACGAFRMVVSMAVAPPQTMADLVAPLVRPAAYFCTIRGRHEALAPKKLSGGFELARTEATDDATLLLYQKNE